MGKKRERRWRRTKPWRWPQTLRISPQKLNLVAEMIRGMKAGKALADLAVLEAAIAQDVKKVLMSAIANAENNHQLDVDELCRRRGLVGKNLVMKRWPRGTWSRGADQKPFARSRIVVAPGEERPDGSESQSDRFAPRHQPYLGQPLVRQHRSVWPAPAEDLKIREFMQKRLKQAGVSKIVIERPAKKCRVTIHTARPGVVIGKKGQDIEFCESSFRE